MEKILICTNHFYPETFRVNDIAFHLAEKGYEWPKRGNWEYKEGEDETTAAPEDETPAEGEGGETPGGGEAESEAPGGGEGEGEPSGEGGEATE